MDQVRSYRIECPLEEMEPGIYHPRSGISGTSGCEITVVVDQDGTQTWTYDYTNCAF